MYMQNQRVVQRHTLIINSVFSVTLIKTVSGCLILLHLQPDASQIAAGLIHHGGLEEAPA